MIGGIGPMELVIVLALALLILGPKRLPAAARSLGDGLRNLRDGLSGKGEPEPAPELPEPAARS